MYGHWPGCQQPYLISIHLYFEDGLLDAVGAFPNPKDVEHLDSRALGAYPRPLFGST